MFKNKLMLISIFSTALIMSCYAMEEATQANPNLSQFEIDTISNEISKTRRYAFQAIAPIRNQIINLSYQIMQTADNDPGKAWLSEKINKLDQKIAAINTEGERIIKVYESKLQELMDASDDTLFLQGPSEESKKNDELLGRKRRRS